LRHQGLLLDVLQPTRCEEEVPGVSIFHRPFYTRNTTRSRCPRLRAKYNGRPHLALPSFEDPARYSFAHGGKDGIPYPVDRPLYDGTISILERAIKRAKLNKTEEISALRRMERVFGSGSE